MEADTQYAVSSDKEKIKSVALSRYKVRVLYDHREAQVGVMASVNRRETTPSLLVPVTNYS